jgi:hypothetical protein
MRRTGPSIFASRTTTADCYTARSDTRMASTRSVKVACSTGVASRMGKADMMGVCNASHQRARQKRLWTAEACCRFPGASPLARHRSSSPPAKSPSDQARDREAPYSRHLTRNQPPPTKPSQISNLKSPPPAAGSGLLGESQLSGRTECARPVSSHKPSSEHARSQISNLRSHFPLSPPETRNAHPPP